MKKEDLILYAVTDQRYHPEESLSSQVEKALKGGATMIQLREKKLTGEALEQEALKIRELCRAYQVPFLINDNVELAKKIDADGVHVGQSDMEAAEAKKALGQDKIVGVTAKTVEQALAAEQAGADYLGSGAVFHTGTKADAKELDHEILQQICEAVSIPVVAIGGINADNVSRLNGRKISGVAVVGGIFGNDDIENGTRELKHQVEEIL